MPHIDNDRRARFITGGGVLITDFGLLSDTTGELNYALTEVIIGYLIGHSLSYRTCNDIVGALENAKDEFQRLVQHPYEDKKIAENGNVYPEEFLS